MPGASAYEQTPRGDVTLIAAGAGVNLVGRLGGAVLAYLFTVVAARMAGADRYGLFVLSVGIGTLAGVLAELGLKAGVVHFGAVALGENDRGRLASVLAGGLGIAAVVGVLVWGVVSLLAAPLERAFGQPGLASSIRLLAPAIPFYAVCGVSVGGIRAFKEMRYAVAADELVRRSVQLGLSFLLLAMGLRTFGLEAGYVGGALVGALVGLYFLHRLFDFRQTRPARPVANLSDLLVFSLPVVGMDVLTYTQDQTETLVVGLLLPAEAVAIYSVALRNAMLGAVIRSAFHLIFAPFVSDLHHRNQFGQLAQLFKMVTKWGFALGLPVMVVMMLFPGPILEVFGRGFSSGAPALVILAAGQLVSVSTGPVGVVITQSGRPRLNMVNTAVFVVLDLMLSFLLIPRYGTTGAALAGAVSLAGVSLLRLVEVRVLLHMHPYNVGFLKPAAAGLCSVACWGAARALHVPLLDGAGWVLGVFLILAVYLVALLALGLDEEDRTVLRAVGRKLSLVSRRGG